MNIEVQTDSIPLNEDVSRFVKSRADLALKGFGDQIDSVSVIVDIAGDDSDGEEVRCLVLMRPYAHPDVVVESTEANLYVAIHKAVDDAGWTLAGSLAHQQGDLLQRQIEILTGQHSGPNLLERGEPDRVV